MKINSILFLFGFCLISVQATAQSMGFGSEFQNGKNVSFQAQLDKVKLSQKYITTLKTCYPYAEEYNVFIGDQKVNIKFEIAGLGKTKACRLVNTVKTKDGYSITRCSLKPDQLKKYSSAMYSLYSRNNFKLPNNPTEADYDDMQTIDSIINQEKVCFTKVDYDETKELRENLTSCSPYTKKTYKEESAVEYKIQRKIEDKCLFSYSVYLKLRQLSGIVQSQKNRMLRPEELRETIVTYTCLLSKFNIEELKLAFEKSKIITNNPEILKDNKPDSALGSLFQQFEASKVCTMTDVKQ